MKHAGRILKEHIEKNHLMKGEIAEAAGISRNYLANIFKNESFDAKLLERLYVAAGLHPGIVFDIPDEVNKTMSDIMAQTVLVNAAVSIDQNESIRELLAEKERIIAEKERLIQFLLNNPNAKQPSHPRDTPDE